MDWEQEEDLLMEQLEQRQEQEKQGLREGREEAGAAQSATRSRRSSSVPEEPLPAVSARKAQGYRDSISHLANSYESLLGEDWGSTGEEESSVPSGGKRKKPKKMLKAVASFAHSGPLRKGLLNKMKGSSGASSSSMPRTSLGHSDVEFTLDDEEEDDEDVVNASAEFSGLSSLPVPDSAHRSARSVPSSPAAARHGTQVHPLSTRSLSNSKNLDEHAVSKTGFAQLLLSGQDLEDNVRQNKVYQKWLVKWAMSASLASGALSAGLPMAALKSLVSMAFPDERVKGMQRTLRGAGLLDNLLAQAKAGNIALHRQLDISKLQIGEKIYRGAGGIVKKALYDDEEVVVKISSKEEISFSLEEFRFEVALMSVLDCPTLMKCTGAIMKGPSEYYMVIPYMERGSLEAVLKCKKKLSWKEKIRISYRIAQGMKYLHYHNIIHRDLKSGNVLLDKAGHVAVTDFGMSRVVAGMMTQNAGTTAWTAPEVFVTGEYSQKADVYSFAMVLYEIFTEKRLYEGHKAWDIPDLVVDGFRLPLPEPRELFPNGYEASADELAMAKKVLALIEQCWSPSLDCRPNFAYISNAFASVRKVAKQK